MEIRSDKSVVYLKTLTPADADQIAENANEREIAYNIAEIGDFPHPYSRVDSLAFVDIAAKEAMNGRGLHFGIHLTVDASLVGIIGLKNIDAKNKRAEIGYWMGKKHWGKGYATQAAKLIVAYGFDKLKLNRIWGDTFDFNTASMKVMKKLGFEEEGRFRKNVSHGGKFVDEIRFALLKSGWTEKEKIKISE